MINFVTAPFVLLGTVELSMVDDGRRIVCDIVDHRFRHDDIFSVVKKRFPVSLHLLEIAAFIDIVDGDDIVDVGNREGLVVLDTIEIVPCRIG